MTTPQLLPDIEALLVRWAKEDEDIQAIVGDRVATSLPEEHIFPFLVLFRVGGQEEPWEAPVDNCLVQFDCYADKGQIREASELARTVAAKARKFQGFVRQPLGVQNSGYIMGMRVVNGPFRRQELETLWPRFFVEVQVWTKPQGD